MQHLGSAIVYFNVLLEGKQIVLSIISIVLTCALVDNSNSLNCLTRSLINLNIVADMKLNLKMFLNPL